MAKFRFLLNSIMDDSDSRVSISIVQYLSPANSGSCGYCKRGRNKKKDTSVDDNDEPSFSLGVWGHELTVNTYCDLCDRGWRRSGKYLYKPIMDKTCCPQYTIRLDVHKFRLSRTHKRVLRNMNTYLKYGKRPDRLIPDPTLDTSKSENSKKKLKPENQCLQKLTVKDNEPEQKNSEKGVKKKEIRKQRAIERRLKRGENIFEYQRERRLKEQARKRTIESFVEDYVEGEWAHKLEIRTVQKGSPEFDRSMEESYNLFCKYQKLVHDDVNTSRKGYEGFLISSPLTTLPADRIQQPALGSYHQQYLLDGKIIAVGVVDLLPRCLSSKYFYYDPDFSFLTLGTYSALREIAFTQELAKSRPSLHYYYMGYYLQDCAKMRYKGKFKPSGLLCDKTFKWMPLEEAVEKIIANNCKFTVFYPDEPRPPAPGFNSIRCMFRDRVIMYPKLREELTGIKLIEFDERMAELIYYMHKVIESVVVFFPSLTVNQLSEETETSSQSSTEQN
jgi:arginine-tRNA-protein transferase